MALGSSTFGDIGGGISDLFASAGYAAKAQGEAFEQANYNLAAKYAALNAQYTEISTGMKEMQQARETYKSLGETTADVAGAGFAESGSALDILRDSASQGALAKQALQEQGYITAAGYEEQAASYRNMAAAAQVAISADNTAAVGAEITGAVKIAAGFATVV